MNVSGSLRSLYTLRWAHLWLPLLLVLVVPVPGWAQGPGGDAPPIAPVAPPSVRPLLVDVEFEGNASLSDEQILTQITTRPTRTPVIKKFFALIGQLIERNPLAPDSVQMQVRSTIDSLGGDFRYLNMNALLADTIRIADLYDDFGYHDAAVKFRIRLDTLRNTSIVRFIIDEGPGFPVKEVTYLGLDEVPENIRDEAVEPLYLRNDERYTKDKYVAQVDQVVDVLRNNGYAFAATGEPAVLIARPPVVPERFDSILVYIYAGDRYRFGQTVNDPDTISDADEVDSTLILDQTEYNPGEWYSREQVEQTVANLYALGTFNLVTIDTAAAFSSDSLLGMRISTRLREQNDLRIAPEISFEQRIREYVTNLGISASYTRLNVLGRAEQLSVSGRLLTPTRNLTAISDFLKEFQGGAAVSFTVPSAIGFPLIGGKRLSWVVSGGYDFSVLDRLRDAISDVTLRGRRITAAGELTYRFPTQTYLDLLSFRLGFQYNKYSGIGPYIDKIAERRVQGDSARLAESGCNPAQVAEAVRTSLIDNLYRVQVLQGDDISLLDQIDEPSARDEFDNLKRTYTATLTAIADSRNNFFTPTRGDLFEGRLEGGFTGALSGSFIKLEGSFRHYGPTWSSDWTYAYRAHAGYIQELGGFPLTPVSSRFSSGGSNSNRGWYSRDMLSTRPPEISEISDRECAEPIINDIVAENRRLLGGLALLELNAEIRGKPFQSLGTSTLARQLNQVVLVFFVDAGNAYFRDREDVKNFTFGSFVENIGLATGFSVGYETPVGPFRLGLGFPIYDPVNQDLSDRQRWITNRTVLSTAVLHVGIGHAF